MQTIPFPDPGRPDTRSTTRFMLWVGRQQWRTQVLGMLAGMAWMLAIALVPAAVGKGVDDGIVPGDLGGLVRWALVLIGLGAICAVTAAIRHYFAVYNWLFASYRGAQLTAQGAERAGPALTRTMPSGEVVAVFANDVMRLGGLYDVMGRFSGAVVSYAVVGAILLAASPALGWLVLLGGPVMLASLSLIVRPLQRRQARQREEAGRLTTLGADTVAGLRVLRGIGGEQTFLRRYEQQSAKVRERGFQVAGIQAALDSAEVLIPGIFVVLVTWLGAREAVTGDITAGQLVAFYGYTAFLTMPLQTAIEVVDRGIRAQIAAGKMLRVMAVQPDHDAAKPSTVAVPAADADLVDPLSGTVIRGGLLTAIVSARPEESSAVADRLGRHGPGPHQTTWGGVRLDDLSIADVRRHVVVSEPDPRLFTGVLRDQLRGDRRSRGAPSTEAATARCWPRSPPPARSTSSTRSPTGSTAPSRSAGGPTRAASASASPSRGRCSPRHPCWCWSSRPVRWTPTPRRGSRSGSPSTGAAARPSSRRSARCCSARPTRSSCSRTAWSPPPAPIGSCWTTRHTDTS